MKQRPIAIFLTTNILLFLAAFSVYAKTADEYFNSGKIYLYNAKYDLAIDNFTKAIELNPDYSDAYYFRAKANKQQCHALQSIIDYTTAVVVPNTASDTMGNLYITYNRESNSPEAIADYTRYVKHDLFSDFYVGIDYAFIDRGNTAQAIADLTKVIELDLKKYVICLIDRGIIYYISGDYSKAIADFTKYIELNNYQFLPAAYNNRAITYDMVKDYTNTWADIHKAEELGVRYTADFLEKLEKASGRDK